MIEGQKLFSKRIIGSVPFLIFKNGLCMRGVSINEMVGGKGQEAF